MKNLPEKKCPKCGAKGRSNFVRAGRTGGIKDRQKWKCKKCGKVFIPSYYCKECGKVI